MNIFTQLAQSALDNTTDITTTTTTTTTNVDPAVAGAIVGGLLFFYFITIAIGYIVSAILLGRIFKKAGIASWIAWVPLYNNWKLLEIGGQPGFWAILALIPFVNIVSIVYTYIALYNIGLKLGKTAGFVALAIFLPLVWLIWLAVDGSKWDDSLGAPSKAVEHIEAAPKKTTKKAA